MLYPLLAAPLALVIQQSPQPPPVTPPDETASALLFASDTRLAQKVDLSVPIISLNEALKQITDQTGIPLKMRDRKVLGEQKICVYAHDTTAKQLLESIAALLRYKNTTSEWQKDATGDGYALSIGKRLPGKGATQNPNATPQAVTSLAIPLTSSDDSAPERLAVAYTVTLNADNESSPTLSSLNYISSVFTRLSTPEQEAERKRIIDDWFTRYDTRSSAIDDKAIPQTGSASDTPPKPNSPASNTIARILSDIARKENVPVLALLAAGSEGTYADSVNVPTDGKTLVSLLNGLSAPPYEFRYKWHKGTLLLRDPVSILP